MRTRQAPQTHVSLSMASMLALSAWCASALAANETQVPCPELVAHTDAPLHEILDEDAGPRSLQTMDATPMVTLPALGNAGVTSEDLESDNPEPLDEASVRKNELPDLATRLPGVSSTDAPRFRRHMLRTDI